MDYGKITAMIVALIGAILFLVSMFVPMIAASNLIDIYGSLGMGFSAIGMGLPGLTISVIGALIIAILHPITVALAFLSILKPGLARVAGILGIVSCVFAIMAVSGLRSALGGPVDYGAAIWVGMAGAIILLISGYVGKMIGGAVSAAPQPLPAQPPPLPSPQAVPTCPTCGRPLTFVQQYNRWYCYNCQKYL